MFPLLSIPFETILKGEDPSVRVIHAYDDNKIESGTAKTGSVSDTDSDSDSYSDESIVTISDDEHENSTDVLSSTAAAAAAAAADDSSSSSRGHSRRASASHLSPLRLPRADSPGSPARQQGPSRPPASNVSLIGSYLRDTTSALVRRMSFRDDDDGSGGEDAAYVVTEFQLSGVKVVVKEKESGPEPIRGRISFFTRSSCRDCTAVRTYLRDRGLPYVEINVDVFPEREKELAERTGTLSVPQIFFNDTLLGGLAELNALHNCGEFDRRLREMTGEKCPDSAPKAPVYGFEDEEEEKGRRSDKMVGIVNVLRHRLPIQDRIMKMKIVRNCFSGSDTVDAIVRQLLCSREKAIEIGKELARKHFIQHVFRENDFEDGSNHFYRLLEHDPSIQKCFNFRGTTNDDEPRTALAIGKRITKLMTAVLEAYASDDRTRLDYKHIANSEEFRRYVNLVQHLQRVDMYALSNDEKMAFFINLYNAMVIHAIIRIGRPGGIDRGAFFNDFQYMVGGYPYSLSTIKNGILRSNRRQPYSFVKPLNADDKRLELVLPKLNPLIHFGLCNGNCSSPTVRLFTPEGVEMELKHAAREFFRKGGIVVDLIQRTVHLTRIIKWYSADFGQEKDILIWILNYLEASQAGLLTHLLNDGGPVYIAYQDFNWSLNSY